MYIISEEFIIKNWNMLADRGTFNLKPFHTFSNSSYSFSFILRTVRELNFSLFILMYLYILRFIFIRYYISIILEIY